MRNKGFLGRMRKHVMQTLQYLHLDDSVVLLSLLLGIAILLLFFKPKPRNDGRAPPQRRGNRAPEAGTNAKEPIISYEGWKVQDDVEEAAVLSELARIGLFDCGLKRHKVLTCGTMQGQQAIARQIAPSIHVDADVDVVKYIAAHVPYLGFVSPSAPSFALRDNTLHATSLSRYLDALVPPPVTQPETQS